MEAQVNWLQDPLPLPVQMPAWTQNLVMVEIESGRAPSVVTENMMAGDVGQVIRSLADEPDVTLTISGSHPAAGKILVAVSGGHYFLGLFLPDGGVYQYAAEGCEQPDTRTTFIIQGEVTEIESRWVADAGTAATAVREWLAADHEAEPSGDWVKM